ncbi:MAG TPA: guanylate kinase [Thermoanaerobaculia bacterium]|nr:guanylate kinase [Thermoanaerobaculia bacterium]
MSSSPTRNFRPDGTLVIVSGPSGAGKTTLINRVRQELRQLDIHLHFSVSHTTRERRQTESEGVDYYFVRDDGFRSMIEREEFIEWARVHEQMYGTSKGEVQARLERGENVILDIDVQGAHQIAEGPLRSRSLLIFLFPPSFEELERRLRNRGLNSEAEIELRLEKALGEIERGFDFYDYVIINDDLTIAGSCLKSAIIAKKLWSKTALGALREMAQRFKEERSGKTTGRD